MRIRNREDFWAGAMFIAIGLGFASLAQQYALGSGARMGPGYFPTLLGVVLLVLGIVVCLGAMARSSAEIAVAAFSWRELLLIVGSVASFGLTLPWLGMVGAAALLILVAAFASHEFNWKETAGLIVVLVALSYLLFVAALDLPLPVWPAFLAA